MRLNNLATNQVSATPHDSIPVPHRLGIRCDHAHGERRLADTLRLTVVFVCSDHEGLTSSSAH